MTVKIPPFRLVSEPMDDAAKAATRFKWAGEDALGRKIG